VWVLETAYGYSRNVIGDVLEKTFRKGQFCLEETDPAGAALRACRTTGADFADCLSGKISGDLGCETTATFDQKAGSLGEFTLL
jgi:predicted nucleic-acid-binding protein